MTSLRRFRLITFDATNTLVQYRASRSKQYGEIGALFGVRCDDDNLAKNFKDNWTKINQQYPNFGLNSGMDWKKWWHLLIANTFADNGAKIPDEKLENFGNHLIELYKTSICWQHCNGSIDLLNLLRTEQQDQVIKSQPPIVLGVVANFDPRLETMLRNMRISKYFNFALNSYDAKVEKPDPEIFALALRASQLRNIKPSECLHIGDGPTTDYLGAKNAGWNSALIHEKSASYLKSKYGEEIDENFVFPSLYDFQKRLLDNVINW